jgi:hypothetical protein
VQQPGLPCTFHQAGANELGAIRQAVGQHDADMLEHIPLEGWHPCISVHCSANPFRLHLSCRFCDLRDGHPEQPTVIAFNGADAHRYGKAHIFSMFKSMHGFMAPQQSLAFALAHLTTVERQACCLTVSLIPTMLVPAHGSDGRRKLFYLCLATAAREPGVLQNREMARATFIQAKLLELRRITAQLHGAAMLLDPAEYLFYNFRQQLEPTVRLAAAIYHARAPVLPPVPQLMLRPPRVPNRLASDDLSSDGDQSESDLSPTTDDGRAGTRSKKP